MPWNYLQQREHVLRLISYHEGGSTAVGSGGGAVQAVRMVREAGSKLMLRLQPRGVVQQGVPEDIEGCRW